MPAGQAGEGVARSPDGVPLAFEARGSGAPALVFVHGWSCDRRYWDAQLEAFAAGHRAVAVDLAGHGESGAGRRRWAMPAFGDDVVAVVRHLELDQVVLVGHSMGGDVAVEAALRLGDQVAGVVWADVYDTLGDTPTGQELEEFLGPFREDFAAVTRAFVRRLCGPSTAPDLVEWVAADRRRRPRAPRGRGRGPARARPLPHAGGPGRFNRLLAEIVDGFAYGTTPGNT
jgi:pimeloyl-ACP methyl ester carboxylesterase